MVTWYESNDHVQRLMINILDRASSWVGLSTSGNQLKQTEQVHADLALACCTFISSLFICLLRNWSDHRKYVSWYHCFIQLNLWQIDHRLGCHIYRTASWRRLVIRIRIIRVRWRYAYDTFHWTETFISSFRSGCWPYTVALGEQKGMQFSST